MTNLLAGCEVEAARVIERTHTLSKIPAPPLEEAARALKVQGWWIADHLDEVHLDETGNLWACLRAGDPTLPAVLVAAHLDTVFGHDVVHGLRVGENGILIGPGCGDDTVAVAALSSLDRLLPDLLANPVWIVATIGEEGLGNLAGVRAALATPPVLVGTMIALEGNYLGRVNTVGVGSERRRVVVTGPGGHAWEESTAPSAVHLAADMVRDLHHIALNTAAKTSINVGIFNGGESINARASHASFDLDLRSEDAPTLSILTQRAEAILTESHQGIAVEVTGLGSRPAGSISTEHPLVIAATRALSEVGVEVRYTAASTDANAAYALGLPAITLGITYGDGTHTEDEWIDPTSIPAGLHALARTITEISS